VSVSMWCTMQRVLGILTEDFRLYHDLVAALKRRGLSFRSLSFGGRVPATVGAILTSPAEASRIRYPNVIAVEDVEVAVARGLQVVRGKTAWRELLIGVDPGSTPGVAIVGDGEVVDTYIASSPEAVARIVQDAARTFPARTRRVRIGHGDPTNRNRIINALSREEARVEIVDEAGTTHRTDQPDVDAAIRIAFTPGVQARPFYEIRPTRGELREIQRRSRMSSGGTISISADLAAMVARGEVTLDQAIDRQRQTRSP